LLGATGHIDAPNGCGYAPSMWVMLPRWLSVLAHAGRGRTPAALALGLLEDDRDVKVVVAVGGGIDAKLEAAGSPLDLLLHRTDAGGPRAPRAAGGRGTRDGSCRRWAWVSFSATSRAKPPGPAAHLYDILTLTSL